METITTTTNDPMIDVNRAYAALQSGKAIFLDVRAPEAYKEAHIPGAVNVNEIFSFLGNSHEKGKEEMKDFFENLFRKAGLTGNEQIITYEDCLKTRFGASCRGYYILTLLGHKNVNVIDGGWDAWVKASLPTTTDIPEVKEGTFKAEWNDEIYCTKEDVLSALKNKDSVLLDVRDFDEFYGLSSSPYGKDFVPRKGRLEGAVHVLWKDFMDQEDGLTTIKSPEEVAKIMNQKGINTDKPIIIYCFKGARASNTFIALRRAGFTNVKNYFASWNEWARDSELPIDARVLPISSNDPMIDVNRAYAALQSGNAVFLDVRAPEAYKEAHIPGAVNVNEIFSFLGNSHEKGKEEMKDFFENLFRKAGLTGKEQIITYEDCLKTRFGASCRGYYILTLLGHKNVNVIDGGWDAWVKAGLPTTTDIPEVKEGTFKAEWNDEIYCTKEDVLSALKNKDSVLLDVRDFDEFYGLSSSPYGKDFVPRKGRLEGAVHVLWKDLMYQEDGLTKIKSSEEVAKIMNEKGITSCKPIIVYCFKGARASNTFIALRRAGFTDVKNYFASWNEWSRDSELPIDASIISS